MTRSAVYVDGFNLYHAINDLNEPYLKWLNLWRLSELMSKGHATVVTEVVFCTAFFPGDTGKRSRHTAYIDALANVGVETRLGHTTKEPMECEADKKGCGKRWDAPREKETDINVSLAAYRGAVTDRYDVCFIVSADTDQAATFRALKRDFPNKKLITVVPPGRPPSTHLTSLANSTLKLTKDHIDLCAFPALVAKQGARTIPRPPEYAPPVGWFHPDDRPQKKVNSN
ncbi:MAG TPA: NYN domain-containing protein [Gemmobacter sp.]|nr:NYN domain-containing protein [Gemmobacter sp.]